METLKSLINVMIILISAGCGFRITSNLLAMIFNYEEKDVYLKKIKNCLIGFVVAPSVFIIKAIVEHYFK